MSKDPFANLPKIDEEEAPEQGAELGPDHVGAVGDVTAGAPPRTILKTFTKWAIPLMGVAIGVWLFIPDDPAYVRKSAPAPVAVDTEKQASDTAAMVEAMKKEASKRPPVTVPVMPGSLPPQANGGNPVASAAAQATKPSESGGYSNGAPQSPLPQGYTSTTGSIPPVPPGAKEEQRQAAIEALLAREREIRASAIEVPKVKLVAEAGRNAVAAPEGLAALQSELSGNSERAAAMRAQQEMQEKMIAAFTPKEQAKSKGANEDFIAANTATANAAPNLTRQMGPQASSIVTEGHVIRTVLLTNVSSDLPGRVIARVTSDVYDSKQRYVVIPKGSQLIGVYSSQVVIGQERLLMAMNRLILPNGNWVSLSGAGATDLMGMSGIKADVNNHFMKMFGSSLVLGASSLLLPRADTTISSVPGAGNNGGPGTAGSIFANSFNDVLKTLLDRNKQIPPTLSLAAGQEFVFMVAQDMAMIPYQP